MKLQMNCSEDLLTQQALKNLMKSRRLHDIEKTDCRIYFGSLFSYVHDLVTGYGA